MPELKVGDSFPSDVVFNYVPYTEEKGDITACGIPTNYDASKGVFSPSHSLIPFCHRSHPHYSSPSSPPRSSQTNHVSSHTTEWANKKVVLFSVPGAFTPGCSARHLPGYINNLAALKAKGVDIVAVIAFNDAWVMSAWGKANGIKGDDILFLSDVETKFSQSLGWTNGERTARYALVIDHGKVTYAEKEPGRDVSVSSAEAVLAKL
ncbi:hypothetical protein G7Y89_g9773 [Cudoniella acicularis]|uniref:Thioredoxin peroxidase n=1 Tax=Cudoniella acicularis TaxID=354080 RepID=A0A8H4RGS9_9HELO|nr:hypothetical protein G7Y89_g9773 [Cudoniella acicularis]